MQKNWLSIFCRAGPIDAEGLHHQAIFADQLVYGPDCFVGVTLKLGDVSFKCLLNDAIEAGLLAISFYESIRFIVFDPVARDM